MGKKLRIGLVAAAIFLLALAVLMWALTRPSKYFKDSTLVATKPLDRSDLFAQMRGGPAFLKPLWKRYYQWRPMVMTTTFSPSQTNACSIHGLLNQCHDVSGIQFFIDRNVAAGAVQFGHTNTMSSTEWVAAFTNALQTERPEWWESHPNRSRKENLVLIRVDRRTILVLPPDRAAFYGSAR
jgi:hypothetical protein